MLQKSGKVVFKLTYVGLFYVKRVLEEIGPEVKAYGNLRNTS